MNEERKKIIFLDFDGCCNSYDEGSYVTNDNGTYGPSSRICEMLGKYCEENGVKIVVSSNWRKFDEDGWCIMGNGKRFQNPLKKLYSLLGGHIIGTLTKERHIVKSKCLILWLEENEDVDYVVFDDDQREEFQTTEDYGIRDHFILTDPKVGITADDLKRASKILGI